MLDGDVVVFNTGSNTVKGRNLARTGQATLTVDDPTPPFAFVIMEGTVELADDPPDALKWASRIGARYMGEAAGEEFGRRNAVPGEYLVRFTPTHISALAGVAD